MSLCKPVIYLLTYVSPPRLDDDGTPTASFLLNLGHAFPGLLVWVVCGTYCNLVLDPTQTIQLNAPFTAKTKWRCERGRGWERETQTGNKLNLFYFRGCDHKNINPPLLNNKLKSTTICNNPTDSVCIPAQMRSIKHPEGTTIIFSISIQLWVPTVRLTAASNLILSWLPGLALIPLHFDEDLAENEMALAQSVEAELCHLGF